MKDSTTWQFLCRLQTLTHEVQHRIEISVKIQGQSRDLLHHCAEEKNKLPSFADETMKALSKSREMIERSRQLSSSVRH